MKLRDAVFALRVVRRREGDAAILYRRTYTPTPTAGSDRNSDGAARLRRVAALAPLAYTAATPLLRAALRGGGNTGRVLVPGPYQPLDADWGARIACFALVAVGLRDPDRLTRAASHLHYADGAECAWWLGMMTTTTGNGPRAVRALRILVEAVQ